MNSINNKYVSIVLLITAIGISAISGIDYLNKNKSSKYLETSGQIIECREEKTFKGGVKLHFQYEYFINEKRYTSRVISYGVGAPHKIVEEYPKGKKIKVFYDKDDNSKSVLIKGVSLVYCFGVLIGVILLGFSINIATEERRQEKRRTIAST